MLADEWWFWAATVLVLGAAMAANGAFRRAAARLRQAGVERRIVDPGSGRRLDAAPAGFWGELQWLLVLIGAWVALSPWIWGYDGEPGAVTTDLSAGIAIALLSAAAVLFPGLLVLDVLLGSWLAIAPWLVGYGSHGGPVGLSDSIAGVAVVVLSLATLSSAARRTRPAQPRAIARVRRNS
jgi:hypothetical protein